MVLTTKEASYIIVLGIVISVLPISSTNITLHLQWQSSGDIATTDKYMPPLLVLWDWNQTKCKLHIHHIIYFTPYLTPLQPVERSPERTMEGGGKGDGLESGQMPTCADL